LLNAISYNAIGQMIRKDMGRLPNKARMENPDVVFAETQSFDYNIRGWWNSSFAYNKLDKKYIQTDGKIIGATANFEHTLRYNFNGNIKEAIWGNATGQDYTYDGLNRLTSAIGKTNTKFSEVLVYDENGNIKTLNRKDINGTEVDKLTYTYEANSNKLISVADAGTAASYPNVGGVFTYDNNGNQTNYLPRGIPTITYNILNLVNTVSIDGKGTQNYTYAADGTKLGFKQGYDVKVKSYIGAVEYDAAGGVARIGTEEGYILKRTGWNENSKDSKFVYYYSVKDHLGNVRLVLDDESNAKLWQRNDYQAFGMHINQPVDGVPLPDLIGINDRYYNGKEFDDQTTWLDYGARQYDYSLGRWMAVDPAGEFSRTESITCYAGNNPLSFVDAGGAFKIDAAFARKYPIAAKLIAYYLPQVVNNPKLVNFYMKHYNLTRKQVIENFTYGEGPTIHQTEVLTPSNNGSKDPKYTTEIATCGCDIDGGKYKNDLYIRADELKDLDKAYKNKDATVLGAKMFKVAAILLHEYVHFLNFTYNSKNARWTEDHGEQGEYFERQVFGEQFSGGAKKGGTENWEGYYKKHPNAPIMVGMSLSTQEYFNTFFLSQGVSLPKLEDKKSGSNGSSCPNNCHE
jgi:RHS repeat-associated protein